MHSYFLCLLTFRVHAPTSCLHPLTQRCGSLRRIRRSSTGASKPVRLKRYQGGQLGQAAGGGVMVIQRGTTVFRWIDRIVPLSPFLELSRDDCLSMLDTVQSGWTYKGGASPILNDRVGDGRSSFALEICNLKQFSALFWRMTQSERRGKQQPRRFYSGPDLAFWDQYRSCGSACASTCHVAEHLVAHTRTQDFQAPIPPPSCAKFNFPFGCDYQLAVSKGASRPI